MQDQLKQIVSTPSFADKRQMQLANLINVTLLTILVSTVAFFLIDSIIPSDIEQSARLRLVILISVVLKILLQMKQLQLVSLSLIFVIWFNVTLSAINRDGIYTPAVSGYIIVIILSGIFFRKYASLFATVICILSSLAIVYGMRTGFIYTPLEQLREPAIVWTIYVLIFGISGVLVYLSARLVNQSIRTSEAIAHELERSSENLRRAESLANLGNFEYDIQTQVIRWSNEIYRILGQTPGIPITIHDYERFLTTETREQLKQKLDGAISNGQSFDLEHRLTLKNGIQKDIHTIGYPVTDQTGQITKVFGILQDVTARKRAERIQEVLFNISRNRHETDHLHALLHYTVEQLSQLISIKNCYIALYDDKTELYSFPYGFDQNRLDWSPQRLDRTLTDYVRRQGHAYLFLKGDYERLENREKIELDDKLAKVWLGAPLKVQQEVIGVIAIQDYDNEGTYQQSDLDLLAYVAENIASIVHSKQAETERLKLQIQKQKTAFLQEFVSHMTHDLKTPLSVIKNSSDLLTMVKDPSRQKEYIERINYQLERLDAMIDDILTISRLDHVQQSNHSQIDMNELLQRTTQQLLPKIHRKHLKLSLDFAHDLPSVMGIEADLTRAVLNLLENAVNYTEEQGQIIVRTYTQDDFVCCEIKDTGIGIHPNDVGNIFDRFFRADNARDFERGTGLGLAIVERIVELHSGKINVDSQLGEGTTFTIQLAEHLSFQKSLA